VASNNSKGELIKKVAFSSVVHGHYARRYRFRNTFTDDCYILLLEASADDDGVQGSRNAGLKHAEAPPRSLANNASARRGRPSGGGSELMVLPEDSTDPIPIIGTEDGIFFLEPDQNDNHFCIAPFDIDTDGVTLIPSGDFEEALETASSSSAPDASSEDDDDDDDDDASGSVEENPSSGSLSGSSLTIGPLSTVDDKVEASKTDPAAAATDGASTPAAEASGEVTTETSEATADKDKNGEDDSVRPNVTVAEVIQLNSTRVFLYDPNKDKFYYADKGQGKIFCWHRPSGTLQAVM